MQHRFRHQTLSQHTFLAAGDCSIRALACALLLTGASVANAQVETAHFTLDNVFLADGSQLTGAFDWTYTVDDFEGGSGTFTELEIPWRPRSTVPPLEQEGMVFTLETNQIEISLNGSFHDYGLDITMKLVEPFSPTQSVDMDLETSFFECCGNGFKDQPFIAGRISPVTPIAVTIDIEPSKPGNRVHPHHDGSPSAVGGLNDLIPVVVLGSSTLVGDPVDLVAADINPTTVTFGPAAGGIAPGSTPVTDQDYDSDGILDAKFDFLMGDTGLTCFDTEASLTGETTTNELFIGTDAINTNCNAQCH